MYSMLMQRVGRTILNNIKDPRASNLSAMMSTAANYKYKTLAVTVPNPFVYHVELNRPKKMNALDRTLWQEIGECFNELSNDPDCRVVVITGSGNIFCAGIDFADAAEIASDLAEHEDIARKCNALIRKIQKCQDSISSLEKCSKPVISAVHSACIGAGVDLITSGDIRFCTKDAWFSIKEIDIGMAADVGTLQRLPRVIGNQSLVRELAYTGRKMMAPEAKECGLVSRVYENKDSMLKGALELATEIASKSPVAVQLTKRSIVYSRDHSVQEGLDHIRDWNQVMLQSEDFMNATVAQATKSPPPTFSKL